MDQSRSIAAALAMTAALTGPIAVANAQQVYAAFVGGSVRIGGSAEGPEGSDGAECFLNEFIEQCGVFDSFSVEGNGGTSSGPVEASVFLEARIIRGAGRSFVNILGGGSAFKPDDDPNNPDDDSWFAAVSVQMVNEHFEETPLLLEIDQPLYASFPDEGTPVTLRDAQGRTVTSGSVLAPGVYRIDSPFGVSVAGDDTEDRESFAWSMSLRAQGNDGIHYVPDEYPTIQAALDVSLDGDTIIIDEGVYSGPGFSSLRTGGRRLLITSVDGAAATIIDLGEQPGFLIDTPGDAVTLQGLTLRGGLASSDGLSALVASAQDGDNPGVIVRSCIFEDHSAGVDPQNPIGGAATLIQSGFARFEDTVFRRNSSTGNGGAVLILGGEADFVRCRFESNTATRGGAVAVREGADVALTLCRFFDNQAQGRIEPNGTALNGFGGAVVVSPNSTVTLDGCILLRNTARDNDSDREPPASGGAVRSAGVLNITSSTLSENAVLRAQGGDPAGGVASAGGQITLANTILWNNTPSETQGAISATYSIVRGGLPGEGNLSSDPRLVDPARNDVAPGAGSPAIDAGSNSLAPRDRGDTDGDGNEAEPLPVDILGSARFIDDPCAEDSGEGSPPFIDIGAVESRPATLPIAIDPPAPAEGDQFGFGMDFTFDRLILGSYRADAGAIDSGTADVYNRLTGAAEHEARLSPPSPVEGAWFGVSAGLTGRWALIGAPRDDAAGTRSGAVYAFRRADDGSWSFEQRIVPKEVANNDELGLSLDVEGDTLAVGARLDDDRATNAGAVYVLTRAGRAWIESQKLLPQFPVEAGRFGQVVVIDGQWMAVGAPGAAGRVAGAGAVELFRLVNGSWTPAGRLFAFDGSGGDDFGRTLALAEDTLTVGAPQAFVGGVRSGAVYAYRLQNGNWAPSGKITLPSPQPEAALGHAVAVAEGPRLIASAPGLNEDRGFIGVYRFRDNAWRLDRELARAREPQAGERFGQTLRALGTYVLASATFRDANPRLPDSGAAQLVAAVEPCETDCPADLSEDGRVDGGDFLLFLNYFFSADPRADFDQNGDIDGGDFLLFLSLFFQGC